MLRHEAGPGFEAPGIQQGTKSETILKATSAHGLSLLNGKPYVNVQSLAVHLYSEEGLTYVLEPRNG